MKLVNMKLIRDYEMESHLRKEVKSNPYLTTISEHDVKKLVEFLDRYYEVYQYRKSEPTKWYWRLTIPFLVITSLLIFFAFMPVKFLFTGNFYWDSRNKFVIAMREWGYKTGTSFIG